MQNPLKNVGLILFLLAVGAGSSLFAQDAPDQEGLPSMPRIVVLPLENALAEEVYQTIMRVFPEAHAPADGNRFTADRNSNSLVMVSFLPEFAQMVEALVKQLDVPRRVPGQPKQEPQQVSEKVISVYTLRHRLAQDFVDSIAIDVNKGRVMFDNTTNSLIVSASSETLKEIDRAIKHFDQPSQVLVTPPQRVPNTYPVQQPYYMPPQQVVPNPYMVSPQQYQIPSQVPNTYPVPQ